MKELGLVGGMGPESTIPYYHDIVYGVQKIVGKDYFLNLTIKGVNVFDVLRLCREHFPTRAFIPRLATSKSKKSS